MGGPQAIVWPIRLWKQDWNLPPLSPHYFSPVPGPFEQTHDASKEALCKWPCKRCHSATTSNGDYQKAHLGPGCSLATWALTRLALCLSMLTWIIYDLFYMMHHVVSQQIQLMWMKAIMVDILTKVNLEAVVMQAATCVFEGSVM